MSNELAQIKVCAMWGFVNVQDTRKENARDNLALVLKRHLYV